MRYRIVMLPFMGRYHCTITQWDPNGESFDRTKRFYDIGPEMVHTEVLEEVLMWLAFHLDEPIP